MSLEPPHEVHVVTQLYAPHPATFMIQRLLSKYEPALSREETLLHGKSNVSLNTS